MLPMFWPAAFFFGVDIGEALLRGRYFGAGKGDISRYEPYDSAWWSSAGALDRAAYRHDVAYAQGASRYGSGTTGHRVSKAKADLDMAGEVFLDNPIASLGMGLAFGARVLTFNRVDMPWD